MRLLLNDSSVLLNLLAADCLEEIVSETEWEIAICTAVRNETKKLRDTDTGEMVTIDIEPLIASGIIQLIEMDDENEPTLYVQQASIVDDGEAMSIAIAANRGLELAIDDKQALNHVKRTFPNVQLWTTPEILKHWSDTADVTIERLRDAIVNIETRSRYFPAKSHILANWWRTAKSE